MVQPKKLRNTLKTASSQSCGCARPAALYDTISASQARLDCPNVHRILLLCQRQLQADRSDLEGIFDVAFDNVIGQAPFLDECMLTTPSHRQAGTTWDWYGVWIWKVNVAQGILCHGSQGRPHPLNPHLKFTKHREKSYNNTTDIMETQFALPSIQCTLGMRNTLKIYTLPVLLSPPPS